MNNENKNKDERLGNLKITGIKGKEECDDCCEPFLKGDKQYRVEFKEEGIVLDGVCQHCLTRIKFQD